MVRTVLVRDTTETPQQSFEAVEGLQTVTLLGPFTVNFNDGDLAAGDPVGLVAVASGALLLRAFVVIDTVWNSGDPTSISVGMGGPDWAPPNYDYYTTFHTDAKSLSVTGNGYELEGNTTFTASVLGRLSAPGELVVETPGAYTGTPPTQGIARVYALIVRGA